MPDKEAPPLQSLADRLAFLLAAKHTSQAALADSLGVSQANVSRWLGGSIPEIKSAVALSKRLDVSLEWLLYGAGPQPSLLDAFILEIRKHRLPAIETSIDKMKRGPMSLQESPEHLEQLKSIRQSLIGLAEHAEKTGEVVAPPHLDNPAKYITKNRKFIVDERGKVARFSPPGGRLHSANVDRMLRQLLDLPIGSTDGEVREAYAKYLAAKKKRSGPKRT